MRSSRLLVIVCLIGAASLTWTAGATAEEVFPYSVASGDPKPDSVVLWTKLVEPAMPDALRVEVATDAGFQNVVVTRDLVAEAVNDYVVKVRIGGLASYSTFYYRFIYGSGAMMEYSPVGRTRTAPAADSNQPVKFAVVYCQDYIGRYFNSYAKLLQDHDEDIDFVVHLGDYVYETTGNPAHQDPDSDRKMVFEDIDGAISLGTEEAPNYAAASLANYRTLYSTYRSDPILQKVHERWPMVVIWDDHEFSDDSWGANATYTGGRENELDTERRRNAERVFFEWVPTEIGLDDEGMLAIDDTTLYPMSGVNRHLRFGSVLDLVLTDSRTNRPDHLIPEDGFPGTIGASEEMLRATVGDELFDLIKNNLDPYVNMDVLGARFPIFKQTLSIITAQAMMAENSDLGFQQALALAEDKIAGNVSVTYINLLFEAAGLPAPLEPEAVATFPRGVSYLFCGKTSNYGSTGSRYMLMKDPYELMAAALYVNEGREIQDLLGGQQFAWLGGVMTMSDTSWRVLANSIMMTPLIVDFTNPQIEAFLPPEFPDLFRTRLLLNADHWDGFPQNRLEMLGMAKMKPNTVVISGDIHATFVTDHGDGVYEFTGPAVSSATWGTMVARNVASNPILGQIPGMDQLIQYLGLLHQLSATDDTVTPSDIAYATTNKNGFMVVVATEEALGVSLMEYPTEEVGNSYYEDPAALDALFTEIAYTVRDGELLPGAP